MWEDHDSNGFEAREQQLRTSQYLFQPLLAQGAILVRHDNTVSSVKKILDRVVVTNTPLPMRIQEELVAEGKVLGDTDAAMYIDSEYRTRVDRYKREIDELREELRGALSNDDLELQQELQNTRAELEEQISKIMRDSENLSKQYANERAKYLEGTDQVAGGVQGNHDEDTQRDGEPQRGDRSSDSIGENPPSSHDVLLTFVHPQEPLMETAPTQAQLLVGGWSLE